MYTDNVERVLFSRVFFGLLPGIEGGCLNVWLCPGDSLFIPPEFFYFVQTGEDDTAMVAMQFISLSTFHRSLSAYKRERKEKIPRSHCFPQFEAVIIAMFLNAFDKKVTLHWARAKMLKLAMKIIKPHCLEAVEKFEDWVRLPHIFPGVTFNGYGRRCIYLF
jgi:hypothetical protein